MKFYTTNQNFSMYDVGINLLMKSKRKRALLSSFYSLWIDVC